MRLIIGIALALVMAQGSTALADTKEDAAATSGDRKSAARDAWRDGNASYNLGQYEEAARHFEAAYKLVQDPAFLFNVAQSYRMAGKLEQALDRYRAFLRTSSADSPNRVMAIKFSDEIKRKQEEAKAAQPIAPVPEATSAPTPVAVPAPAADAVPAAPVATVPPVVPVQPVVAAGPSLAVTPAPAQPPAGEVPAGLSLTSGPPAETSPAQPFYKTWWFWTGAGAVVVAGTVTAILLARGSADNFCAGSGNRCEVVK